jgi:hypothetical protein
MLTEGVKVSYQKEGSQRGDLVWLVDFANPENNDFVVANQLTVIENGVNKRPDVVLLIRATASIRRLDKSTSSKWLRCGSSESGAISGA